MPKTLSIYPGIGIARLGDSESEYFLAPEVPGLGPLELTTNDSIVPISSVRAGDARVRRQGARFRIFEIETNSTGAFVGAREITSDDATIEWSVELANEKAAAGRFISESNPEASTKRNPNVPEAQLAIRPLFPKVSGNDNAATASTPGRFKGTDVYLGELRTDHKGRLIVLGGRGVSGSVPAGKPIGLEPNTSGNNFANNEFWYDDIADGPVSATVTMQGAAPIAISDGWVIVSPPDFAPGTRGLSTMYDIAFQAAVTRGWLTTPATPSYKRDVLPILRAVSNYRWVSNFPFWENFPRDWAALGQIANASLRTDTRSKMQEIEDFLVAHFNFTASQSEVLDRWAEGSFIEDFSLPDSTPEVTPIGLNVAALEQGVGGGFFPGIEAGIMTTYPQLYAAPFRIRRDAFQHGARNFQPRTGMLTRNMACPWQADFWDCKLQSEDSLWWPAQRPIEVFVPTGAGTSRQEWDRGVTNHRELCERVMKLGFIMQDSSGGAPVVIEKERVL